jgi:hypothetical protein
MSLLDVICITDSCSPALPVQKHVISSAIAEHFILQAHNQFMNNDQTTGLFLFPVP